MAPKKKARPASQKQKPEPKVTGIELKLNALFDSYKHAETDGTARWIQMPNFQRYAGDIGVTDPESFEFLHLMYLLECPACGVLTRDNFVRIWKQKGADSLEAQSSAFLEESKRASTDASPKSQSSSKPIAEAVYLHAFILFTTPIPPSPDAVLSPFASKPSIRIDLPIAVEIWRVLFQHPALRWNTETTNWLDRWIEFLERETDDLAPESGTRTAGNDTDDEDEKFKPVTSISKHVWGALPSFSRQCIEGEDLEWWSPEQNWPTLVDDFVVWVKAKRQSW